MKKIVFRVIILLLTIILTSSPVISISYDKECNEIEKYGKSSQSDVVISAIKMLDYNIICKGLGGQRVSIGVWIMSLVDIDLIEPFTISLYINQSEYIDHRNITKDMIDDGKNRVIFNNVHLKTKIGIHTLDAYINDDNSTHKYCLFRTTLIGLGSKVFPLLERILDRIFK